MKNEEQMIDNVNPNSQFHPYQPMDATPVSERPISRLDKARALAQKNPGMLLGGLAALVIGLGLIRRR